MKVLLITTLAIFLTFLNTGIEIYAQQTSSESMIQDLGSAEHPATPYAMAVYGDFLYTSTGLVTNTFNIVDISNPGSPELISSRTFEDITYVNSMVVYNDMLFVGSSRSQGGLKIYDLSETPENPEFIAYHTSVTIPETGNQRNIRGPLVIKDDVLTARHSNFSLLLVDISDLEDPSYLSGISYNSFALRSTLHFAENDEMWYALGNAGCELTKKDISDITNPVFTDNIEFEGNCVNLNVLDEQFAFIQSHSPHQIHSFNPSTGEVFNTLELGEFLTYDFTPTLYHTDTNTLIIPGTSTFLEVRVSETGEMTPLETYDGFRSVVLNGEYLYAGVSVWDGYLRVYQITDTPTSVIPDETAHEFYLSQNYPNPFNPSTVIGYQLPAQSDVTLEVFDMLGRRVALLENGLRSAGRHEVSFDASSLNSGIYIYRIQAGEFVQTRKMMLVK